MNKFMEAALMEAEEGIACSHGGPFGAVIVKDNKIIGRGHNEVLKQQDCTCHGEIMAIRNACKALCSYDLSDCELYTTAYPCPMCKGAIQWANIKKVYYGCNMLDTKSIGFTDEEFYDEPIDAEEVNKEACQALFAKYINTNAESYQPKK